MKITPHLDSSEFGCRDGSPYPPAWYNERLVPLCEVLEVIRAVVGGPLRIVSGYRTIAHNRRVGGAADSRHVHGDAADVSTAVMDARELHRVVLELHDGGLIPAMRGLGAYRGWVHIDCRPSARLVRWSGQGVG